MSNPIHIVTVIVVLKHRNKYLLVQRDHNEDIFPGKWQNLGGKVEVGERIEEALRREVKEEIGISIDKMLQPIFIQSYSWDNDGDTVKRLGVIFMFKLKKRPRRIKLSKELAQFGWFTFLQARKLETIGMDSITGTLSQLKIAEKT
ncbi:NUDIX hydrolase [Candidatus Dojkabacteria bacterium]|nr:NUDIX hydrolase [Candidatus Dojkabacteria bacterium]